MILKIYKSRKLKKKIKNLFLKKYISFLLILKIKYIDKNKNIVSATNGPATKPRGIKEIKYVGIFFNIEKLLQLYITNWHMIKIYCDTSNLKQIKNCIKKYKID